MSNIYDIYKDMILKMFNFYCLYLLQLIHIKKKNVDREEVTTSVSFRGSKLIFFINNKIFPFIIL